MIILEHLQKALIEERVKECKGKTAYTDKQLASLIKSGYFYLETIISLNDKTVDMKSLTDKDIQVKIEIEKINYFHNELQVFASTDVLRYLRETLEKIGSENKSLGIRIGSNGYGTAMCFHYNPYLSS